jgi:metal-dependent hydrolase (beta-lactamase superfamily II)
MASGTSFRSLQDVFLGLEHLDHIRGLPYGGAASSKLPQKHYKKPSSSLGMVASIQEVEGDKNFGISS